MAEAVRQYPMRFRSANFISPRAFNVPANSADAESISTIDSLSGLPVTAAELIQESTNSGDPNTAWPGLIRMTLGENPVDLKALENPDLMQMHVDQARSNVVMGATGVGQEWQDYGASLDRPDPVTGMRYSVLGGGDDNIDSIRRGIQQWAEHLDVAPIMVPHAAHLIFLTHTIELLRKLDLS